MKKGILAAFLSLCMVMTMTPTAAMAADIQNDGATPTSDTVNTVLQEQPAMTELDTQLEQTMSQSAEPTAKAEMVAEVNGQQYATLEEAIAAAQTGDVVELLDDTTLKTIITIKDKSITLDMNGKTITYGATTEDAGAFIFSENSNVVICGNGMVTFDDSYLADDSASTGRMFETERNAILTIEDGTFLGGLTCILADHDSQVYIKGGSFSAYMGSDGRMWLLNRQDGTNSRFFVTGGTFKNYDPYNSKTENPEENFCAEGYVSTSEVKDGITFYTVEAATAKVDGKYYATLGEAVAAVHEKTGEDRMAGTTIELLQDASGGGIGAGYKTISNGTTSGNDPVNLTLDLGGHTYTITNPAVGSSSTETNGFQLLQDSVVTIQNGTIKTSLTNIIIQNYCNLTLDDVQIEAPSAWCVISNNCGEVNIIGDTSIIGGTDSGKYAFDVCATTNYPTGVTVNIDTTGTIIGTIMYDVWTGKPDPNLAKLNIKNGNFVGGFYIEDALIEDAKANFSISGGYFTSDPSAYLTDNYAAVASDKDGYIYQVVEGISEPAEVVPEDPQVSNSVSNNPNASTDDKNLANDVTTALQGENNKVSVDEDIVKAAAGTVASQNTVTVDEGTQALKQGNIAVDTGETVTIVVQPYLDVTLTDANSEGNNFTVDITPMYRTVATTNADDIVVKGETTDKTANAVVIGDPKELTINKTVEVSIPLPKNFTSDEILYVHHQKNNVTYVYEGVVEQDNNTLTFTNPHGFSLFTITAAEPQAKIGDVNYATLQDAVDAVEDSQTITLLANGSATVSRDVTFKIKGNYKADITAGSGYKLTQNSDTYTITEKSTSSGGASHPEADSSSSANRYQISKPSDVENGSIKVSDSKAQKGDTVTITVTPDEGYELDKLAVYDEDGDEIDLEDEGNGKFTFEMPKGDVEIEVSFAAIADEAPKADFADVAADAWYADAVQYVFENGMMSGTSETTFSPDLTTTRGMIVTILYRLENEPTVTGTTAFTDVAADQYYADAVAWAAQNGIVSGTSATTFAPNAAITREQMAAILYRYAQFKGYDVSAKADLSAYTDAAKVGAYATDAMAWANSAELITGTSATTLTPAGNATRAQVATILMRFCENIVK